PLPISTAGNGNHTCALSDGLTISTRGLTSNLRQASGLGVNNVSAKAPRGGAAKTVNAAPLRKNSRLIMSSSPVFEFLTKISATGAVQPGTSLSRFVNMFI